MTSKLKIERSPDRCPSEPLPPAFGYRKIESDARVLCFRELILSYDFPRAARLWTVSTVIIESALDACHSPSCHSTMDPGPTGTSKLSSAATLPVPETT